MQINNEVDQLIEDLAKLKYFTCLVNSGIKIDEALSKAESFQLEEDF